MSSDFWGAVPVTGRGSLPFSLIHGESLIGAAVLALESAGVELYDDSLPWSWVQASGRGLVLHDPLCPLTPPAFIDSCVIRAEETGAIVVGVRPVTDTVKQIEGEVLGQTVDRESLVSVVSPVVIPASVIAELDERPEAAFADLVAGMRARWPVDFLSAPPTARRVGQVGDIALLEALSPTAAR